MADLSITAGNVLKQANTMVVTGLAGETITRGMAVYKESTTNYIKKANAAAANTSTVVGIALNDAGLDQPISYATSGQIKPGATLTLGERYFLSDAAAGGICPSADVGSGSYVSYLGTAISTTILNLNIDNSGVAVA